MVFNDEKEIKDEFDFILEDEDYLPEGFDESQDYFFGKKEKKDDLAKEGEKAKIIAEEKSGQDDFDKKFSQNIVSDKEEVESKKADEETIFDDGDKDSALFKNNITKKDDEDLDNSKSKSTDLELEKTKEEKSKNNSTEMKQNESSTEEKHLKTTDKEEKTPELTNDFYNIDSSNQIKDSSMEEFLSNNRSSGTESEPTTEKLDNIEEKNIDTKENLGIKENNKANDFEDFLEKSVEEKTKETTEEKVEEDLKSKKSISEEEDLSTPIKEGTKIEKINTNKDDVINKSKQNLSELKNKITSLDNSKNDLKKQKKKIENKINILEREILGDTDKTVENKKVEEKINTEFQESKIEEKTGELKKQEKDTLEKKSKNEIPSTSKSTINNIAKKVGTINKEETAEEMETRMKTLKESKQQQADFNAQDSDDEDFSDFSSEEDENLNFNNVDHYEEHENIDDKKNKKEEEEIEAGKRKKEELQLDEFKLEPLLDDKQDILEDEEEILKEIENINLNAMHEGESIDEKEKKADKSKEINGVKSENADETTQKGMNYGDVDLISKYKKEDEDEDEDENLKKKLQNISNASKSEKESFISNEVAKMAQDSIAKLKKANENNKESDISQITLESLVRSSLEKKLSSWLDENLAEMVEEIVQKEINAIVNKKEK
jgi:cell pole-organizing protein PopZ